MSFSPSLQWRRLSRIWRFCMVLRPLASSRILPAAWLAVPFAQSQKLLAFPNQLFWLGIAPERMDPTVDSACVSDQLLPLVLSVLHLVFLIPSFLALRARSQTSQNLPSTDLVEPGPLKFLVWPELWESVPFGHAFNQYYTLEVLCMSSIHASLVFRSKSVLTKPGLRSNLLHSSRAACLAPSLFLLQVDFESFV
jgi:hypothetical protein